jgi:hypothetical protein
VAGTVVTHPDGRRYVVEARVRGIYSGEHDVVGFVLAVGLYVVNWFRGAAWLVEVRPYPKGRAVLTERVKDNDEARPRVETLLAEIASGRRSFD